ncbi:hypothetical protein [Streptomyces sp. HB2AG]|uniref:hypothetical protein n=1 Tax=Streptomyces sp. HB2AG TaxID=2983400 RepID=UPI0022AAE0A9|nr:hypothetical protein [Streptomyces sp. HB2AG]MCZ2526972.1 hypothetical protein [Streptomyces sp. HB2AG]
MTPPSTPDQAPERPDGVWALWLLTMVLFSLVVGMAAGVLAALDGAGLPKAVLVGGAAFGTTMGICLSTVTAVKELRRIT